MKANELRLGNYIQYRKDGCMTYDTVKSIYYDEELQLYRIELNSRSFNLFHITINGISPIPLTDEILLKCGFKKRSESRCTMILPLEHGDPLTDKLCPSIQWWIGNDYMSICRCGISAFSFKIQSLHQLQNIFYDLTGEELNINL